MLVQKKRATANKAQIPAGSVKRYGHERRYVHARKKGRSKTRIFLKQSGFLARLNTEHAFFQESITLERTYHGSGVAVYQYVKGSARSISPCI